MIHKFNLSLTAGRKCWEILKIVAGLFVLATVTSQRAESQGFTTIDLGPVEMEFKSEYSHIRIRRKGDVRTLCFVRDAGYEARQSQVDLTKPHELGFPYLKYMFVSYVFRPEQEKVLIVGLGGGSMVHFLNHYDPNVNVDVVEIDPVIVGIADKYFGVRSKQTPQKKDINIFTADGMQYLADTKSEYDVIYMDAFLRPMQATDSTGVPLKLRTEEFYKNVKKRLKPNGLVAFNIHDHRNLNEDLKTIRDSFPQMYEFLIPSHQGWVVVASMSPQRASEADLISTAKLIDRRFHPTFSFENMISTLERGEKQDRRTIKSDQGERWVGMKVMAVDYSAQIQIGDRRIGTLADFDWPLTVENENGNWIWLSDTKIKGWVEKTAIESIENSLRRQTEKVRNNPNAQSYNHRGLVWHAMGEYDNAINDYTEAIRLEKDERRNGMSYGSRGEAWLAKGEAQTAVRDLTEGIRLLADRPTAHYEVYRNRAIAYDNLGNKSAAETDRKEAERIKKSLQK